MNISDREKTSVAWPARIGPPLLLLPLFFLPLDAGSLIYWMSGAIAALVSAVALLKAWMLPAQTGQADAIPFWQKHLRSLLTIALLILAIAAQWVMGINEDRYVIGLADALQSACKNDAAGCLSNPQGWARPAEDGPSRLNERRWRYEYRTDVERHHFQLRVIKGRDDELCIEGGRNSTLVFREAVQCR